MKKLQKKIALLTGASSGIGVVLANSLSNEGVEIIETGAGHVYTVQKPNGEEFLVPSSGNIVQFFDSQNKKLVIDPIPGLMES